MVRRPRFSFAQAGRQGSLVVSSAQGGTPHAHVSGVVPHGEVTRSAAAPLFRCTRPLERALQGSGRVQRWVRRG